MTPATFKETQNDLQNEQEFKNLIECSWNVFLIKMPALYRVDFAVVQSGKVTGFIEYKCRTFPSTRYKQALLSLDKWLYLHVLSDATKVPVYLAIGYSDVIALLRIDKTIPIEITIKDSVPFVLIDLNFFERIY
jgi:hypothetical protein